MTIDILLLIAALSDLKAKGCTEVELTGTLMCQQDGNTIIASTQKQH